jgi:lipid-binding SYLF domain-containing protein
MRPTGTLSRLLAAGVALSFLSGITANAADPASPAATSDRKNATEQQKLVDSARLTIEALRADKDFPGFAGRLEAARGVIVVPNLVKAGYIVGGEGGRAIVAERSSKDRAWSYPAFYTLGSASLGLQIGAQVSETVFLVMSERAMERLRQDQFKLGADASIAVATVGAGVEAGTTSNMSADIIAYSRSKGLFGGLSLEGSVVDFNEEWTQTYYGQRLNAVDILVNGKARNTGAEKLRLALAGE